MASSAASGTLSVAWDGATPAIAPAGATVVFSVNEYSAAGFEIGGTFVGTVVLEATINGVTWFSPNTFTLAKAAGAVSFTAVGRNLVQLAGITALRARMSAWTSGAAAVVFSGSLAPV